MLYLAMGERRELKMNRVADFKSMAEATAEDYAIIASYDKEHIAGVPGRVLRTMENMDDHTLGFPVTRLIHSLQTATFAEAGGESEEMVVAALIHDIGDDLAPENHGNFAADILRPYVSERTHWIVAHHDIFQGIYFFQHFGRDPNERERYRGHPHFEACANFCERYDQMAFDAGFTPKPLEAFKPLVNRVLSRQPYSTQPRAPK
jgi:predicted HD phosphohydrolase